MLLLPVFFIDGFHDPFASSKVLLSVGLGVPAALLLMRPRARCSDPLHAWGKLLVVAPLLVAVSESKGPGFSFPVVMTGVGWIFLELGAAHGGTTVRTRRLVTLLAASTVPVLVVGLLRRHEAWFEFLPDRTDVALASTIGNSLELAEFSAPVAILTLLLPAAGRTWGWPLVASAAALVVLSESRAGALALVAGLAVAGLLLCRGSVGPARKTGSVALTVSAVLVIGALLVTPERAQSVLDTKHPTNAVRLGLWSGAVDLWLDDPFLGCGAGRFEAAFPPFRDGHEWEISGFGVVVEEPHQELLWMLAEGGLLGLVALLGAAWIVSSAWRLTAVSTEPERRQLAAVVAGALVAFLVTACVRAPLHHPCGLMPAALAAGLLSGARGGGPHRAARRCLSYALLAATTFVAWQHLTADRHLHVARWAKVRASEELASMNLSGLIRELTVCKTALDDLSDHGPQTAARAWRAALVGRELATLREHMSTDRMRAVLTVLDEDGPERWLPTFERIVGFLDETLERSPHHAFASLHRAMVALETGDVGYARALVDDQATWGRSSWPEVLEVRGRTALRLGSDPETFGAWLDDLTDPETFGVDERQAAAEAYEGRDDEWAVRHALRQLGRCRFDEHTLRLIAVTAYRSQRPDSEGRKLGDYSVARSRLLFAREAERDGDANLVATHLRIARRRDPRFLDPIYVAARVAARAGDADAARARLAELVAAGVPAGRILSRVSIDSDAFDKVASVLRELQ